MFDLTPLRRRLASQIRDGAWRMLLLTDRTVKRVIALPSAMHDAARRFSGKVAGCGCTHDDAESCDNGGGDWCHCKCHETNVHLDAPLPEEDKHLECDQCGAHPLASADAKALDFCPNHAMPEPYLSCDGVLRWVGCGDPGCCS